MALQRLMVKAAQLQNGDIRLLPAQQHYLQRVLRLGGGDRFIAMDGQGHAWLATLVTTPDQLTVPGTSLQATILEPMSASTELAVRVTLVAALPKGNGFDEVVRQATELGIDQIRPVMSDRTLLNPSAQKQERWQRIANEAAEQSERLYVPSIAAPMPFTEYLQHAQADIPLQNYLCVARGSPPHLLDRLQAAATEPAIAPISVAIGPEGGWTDAEVATAIAAGYQPVSLGDRVLRAVTAPLVALALIAAVWEAEGGREKARG